MQVALKDMDLVDPVEVLKTDLLTQEIEVQLEAVRGVAAVALAIGPEKTRDDLISTIDTICFPDPHEGYTLQLKDGNLGIMEEVLREIARLMDSSIVPLLGGDEHILPVLLLLQKLSVSDETVVREAAINSIISIAKAVDVKYVEQHVLTVVANLAKTSRWAARTGAAAAATRLFQYLESEKCKEICQFIVLKLCKDKMPMARHEAICNVYHMILPMGSESIGDLLDFIVPILRDLMNEQQDDFRCHVIQIVKTLLKLGSEELLDVCQEYLGYMFCDHDWRIRQRLFWQLMEFVTIAPTPFVNDEILPNFVKSFHDSDTIIRMAAIKLAPEFLSHKKLQRKNVKMLVTHKMIMDLVVDDVTAVREVVSGSVLDILTIIFGTNTTDEEKNIVIHIMDKFFFDDSGEVRANFGKGLKKTLSFCGEKYFINRIIPLVSKLLEDPKWRVRAFIYEHINLFAEMLKAGNMDEQDFCKILERAFKDPVSDARKHCTDHVDQLVSILGPKWIVSKLLDVVRKELNNQKTKYQFRLVPIRIAETLATSFASENSPAMKELLHTAVEMMLQGSEDIISNVRLASADAIVSFIKTGCTGLFQSDIRSVLETLNNDDDHDIRLKAVEGLSLLE